MQTWWEFLDLRKVQASRVVGIDESGRGPLAGPLVVAGVVLPRDHGIVGLNDSKKLTSIRRQFLFEKIGQVGEVFVETASAKVIDRLGIFVCVKRLMQRIAEKSRAEFILTDAVGLDVFGVPQMALIRGDALVDCIAAASIVAKVTRDRLMTDYEKRYPGYGLSQHKGYGTVKHFEALQELGPSRIHRMSFLPASLTINN